MEDKRKYCDDINRQMQFHDKNLYITVDNVSNNGQLRDAFKLGSNSMLGKLSQDPDADQQVFLSNQIDLDRLFPQSSHRISRYYGYI